MDNSPPGHPETVATTWSLAFQHVEQANPAAADLLRLCAFLAPDVIPEDILTKGASVLGKVLKPVVSDPMQLNEAIQELRRYSLLKRNPETRTLSIHRLVQVTLQDTMPSKAQQQWAERAVRALNEVFPHVNIGTWKQAQPYLPHAEVCQSFIEHYAQEFPEAALLLYNYGGYFYHAAKYQQAESLYQQALHIYEQAQGPEHPDTATTLYELARLYQNQGKYKEAEPLYQRALAIDEQVFGVDHPEVATDLEGYARLLSLMKRPKEAEALRARAKQIRDKHSS